MSGTTVLSRRPLSLRRLVRRAALPLGVGLIGAVTLGASASAAPLELGVTNTSDVRTTLRGDTAAAPRQLLRLENFAAQADASTLHVIGHSVGDQGVLRVNNASTGRGAVVLADVFPFFASSSNITGNTRGVSGQVVSPDGYGGFFSNRTTGVGTAGVGLAALGRSHDIDDTAIGPDGFDGAIEAAGPNGVEGNSITAGGFGVTGDGPAVGVNGTATTASGRGGNFTGGAQGIGVDANGGLTGLQASGTEFAVDADVTAAGAVAVSGTAGASSNDAIQGNSANGIGDAVQGTATGSGAYALFGIGSGTTGATGAVVTSGGNDGLRASSSDPTDQGVQGTNTADGATAAEFIGNDTGIRVDLSGTGSTFGEAINSDVSGDADGNGTANDDGHVAINGISDDINSQAVGFFSTAAGSTAASHEAVETVGFLDVNGNARVTGNLDVVGTCCGPVMDHPQDPANYYLRHTSVSSPELKNLYDGVVTTDGDGNATVELPDYFGALNKDFRYQLTAIGGDVDAWVAEEIGDGGRSFKIGTDQPDTKVSWQVTGIRKDAFARTNPLKVVERKTGSAVGRYLTPQAFGKSPSMFIPDEDQPVTPDASSAKSLAQAEADRRKVAATLRSLRGASAPDGAPSQGKQPARSAPRKG